jgi:putative selenate reductase FAD-binding subunit
VASITAYHRPQTLGEALALLHRTDARSVVLGGGTSVVARHYEVDTEVIDLQNLAMSGIEATTDGRLGIGALTTLADLAMSPLVPAVVREAAKREQPSTLRSLATIGGTVVDNGPESEFLAALLAFGATVTLQNLDGTQNRSLDDVLGDPSILHGAIVTGLAMEATGEAAVERTARTPQDVAIVCVVARKSAAGLTIAASGVSHTVCVVTDVDALDPPGDFRGSGEYRKHLAVELVNRVLITLGAAS